MVEAARQLHTPKVWEDMSPKLYTTFWVLSLYDLYVPTGRYEDEVRKAREAIKDIDDKSDMVSLLEITGVYKNQEYVPCQEGTKDELGGGGGGGGGGHNL